MPGLLHETLERTHSGELSLEWKSTQLAQLREQLRENERRTYFAIAGGGLIVAAVLLGDFGANGIDLSSARGVIGLLAAAAGAAMLWYGWPRRSRG